MHACMHLLATMLPPKRTIYTNGNYLKRREKEQKAPPAVLTVGCQILANPPAVCTPQQQQHQKDLEEGTQDGEALHRLYLQAEEQFKIKTCRHLHACVCTDICAHI